MSFAPYAALWLVLVVAAAISLVAGRRPRLLVAVTLVAPLLALSLWLSFHPDDPIPTLNVFGRQWAISTAAWQLTGIVLLLMLTAAVRSIMDRPIGRFAGQFAQSSLLAAASLSLIWAADDRTRVMGLALFAAVWGGVALLVARERESTEVDRLRFPWVYLIAVFPLWLAGVLPAGRFVFGLLAATILIAGHRRENGRSDHGNPTLIMLDGLPLVVAGAVLVATLFAAMPSTPDIVIGTAIGLFLLFSGLIRVWRQSPTPATRATGLALAGISLTAAVWAGQEALVAGIRLAVFVPLLPGLAASFPATSAGDQPADDAAAARPSLMRWLTPGSLAVLIAYIVAAGLPLAVGFPVLASLYEAWRASGGWVLLIVVAMLWSLLLAALIISSRSLGNTGRADRDTWLRGAILLLPVIGLLSLNAIPSNVSWLVWAVIGVTAIGGLIIGLFGSGIDSLAGALHEALTLPQPADRVMDGIRRVGNAAVGGLADALTILDGDYGLLWILGLILLLIWII